MNKKYIVRLSNDERAELKAVVRKLKGSSQKARRAQILLKSDASGPGWTDVRISEAFSYRVQTIENLRKRLVTEGFEIALHGTLRQVLRPTPLQRARPPFLANRRPAIKKRLTRIV